MDIIWAPWRMKYILGEKKMGCFVCEALPKGVCVETLILRITPHSLVLLNRYPYISGHLMVIPKAHVSSLDDLSAEQMADLHETLRFSIRKIQAVLSPHGLNVGMNLGRAAGAGLEEHIHYHIVPRFMGDNNAMNVLGDVRVIPESLEDTWNRFLPAFSADA